MATVKTKEISENVDQDIPKPRPGKLDLRIQRLIDLPFYDALTEGAVVLELMLIQKLRDPKSSTNTLAEIKQVFESVTDRALISNKISLETSDGDDYEDDGDEDNVSSDVSAANVEGAE